ncbi:hemolymph trypsin inhibitor B-like [Drosophila hydei]|uniref:Hemolymph trypsin inhibitor B-like n=1 Tax=Drosophila hydei TaxID=7224 RepID=A0A6J1LT85_DROHY|nr:hemolymph trypsin inhibitor B-like [Drosophila hydei]
MKFAAVLCVFLGLFGLSLGSKDPVCEEEPSVVGMCRAVTPRWSYFTEYNDCRLFNYGGCSGNQNNFVDQESCVETCVN